MNRINGMMRRTILSLNFFFCCCLGFVIQCDDYDDRQSSVKMRRFLQLQTMPSFSLQQILFCHFGSRIKLIDEIFNIFIPLFSVAVDAIVAVVSRFSFAKKSSLQMERNL